MLGTRSLMPRAQLKMASESTGRWHGWPVGTLGPTLCTCQAWHACTRAQGGSALSLCTRARLQAARYWNACAWARHKHGHGPHLTHKGTSHREVFVITQARHGVFKKIFLSYLLFFHHFFPLRTTQTPPTWGGPAGCTLRPSSPCLLPYMMYQCGPCQARASPLATSWSQISMPLVIATLFPVSQTDQAFEVTFLRLM